MGWLDSKETLWNACIDGDSNGLRSVLSSGADLNVKNGSGLSALHLAVKHGWSNLVELLLEAEVDVLQQVGESTSPDNHLAGYSATHIAAFLAGRTDSLVALLKHGHSTVDCRARNRWTPLHCATFAGRYESMRLLLEADANPDARAVDGRTPLMLAAGTAVTRSVRLLLGAAADAKEKDNEGYTALHFALDTKTMRILNGKMPLRAECYETAYLLVLSGCDPDAATQQGATAIEYLSPPWQMFFSLCYTWRSALLRGGTLPFNDVKAPTVAAGVNFDELLTSEFGMLLSLGIERHDADDLKSCLYGLWGEVSRLRSTTVPITSSPRRRAGVKPAPPPAAPVGRVADTVRYIKQNVLPMVALLFVFWLGQLVERYKEGSTLLYLVSLLFPDPFAEGSIDVEPEAL